jgi:hypothetical protein
MVDGQEKNAGERNFICGSSENCSISGFEGIEEKSWPTPADFF